MSAADRCGALAAITGALALATGHAFFGYATVILLWWAFFELSVTLRAERRKSR